MPPDQLPSFVICDLDNTLAASKQPIDAEMAGLVGELLSRACVAIISGGALEQLQSQVAAQIPIGSVIENLYLLPTSGAALYTFDGAWQKKYEEALSSEEVTQIVSAIDAAVQSTAVIATDAPSYGERTEARGAQVTFSALGQQAPVAEKQAWDPDMTKRRALQTAISALLPAYDVKMGGLTSIDVTKRGVNKAFGIRKLSEATDIPIGDMLYLGDQLSDGGNDEVVKETGITTHAVKDPAETKEFIRTMLAQN